LNSKYYSLAIDINPSTNTLAKTNINLDNTSKTHRKQTQEKFYKQTTLNRRVVWIQCVI
jgi:hypothetical protein